MYLFPKAWKLLFRSAERRPEVPPRHRFFPRLGLLENRVVPALVPLTVHIGGVGALSSGTGQLYVSVLINGVEQDTRNQAVTAGSVFVDWNFTQTVDDSAGPVNVSITLLNNLGGDPLFDQILDIDPKPGVQSLDLKVDPLTGVFAGDVPWPNGLAQGNGDGTSGNINFSIGIPGTTTDSDGDGLPDSWEKYGLDLDADRSNGVDLPLNTWGADPNHKDLFLELDWMAGAVPTREVINALKAAFARAPVTAGDNASALPGGMDAKPNPDGLPGINLHIDTGSLTDASGQLVGDNLGGGNLVPTANVSNLTSAFYNLKNGTGGNPGNFNPLRKFVFRYAIRATGPTNTGGTSSGGNTSTTLNDSTQSWLTNEWAGINVTITGGTGAGQTLAIASNTATQLTLAKSWTTTPDATSTYSVQWSSGGWSEIGGNDIIVYNTDAGSFMHELGHSLNLHHGGSEDTNYKPNYVSVMNYDHQFGIPQNGGASIIDYSPARISFLGTVTAAANTTLTDAAQTWTVNQWANGYVDVVVGGVLESRQVVSNTATQLVLAQAWSAAPTVGTPYALSTASPTRGAAPLPAITESALSESLVLDPTDTANRMIFSDPTGKKKIQYPLDGLDRNGDGTPDGPDYNQNGSVDTATYGSNVNAPYDTTISTTPFNGQDDWSVISLPFTQFGDSASGPVRPEDTPLPDMQQLQQTDLLLHTTDLSLSVSPSSNAVDQGSHLVYTFTVTNNGPNPADGSTIVDTLPFGVDYFSANTSNGTVAQKNGTVTWTVGTVYPGLPVTLKLEVIPQLVGPMTSTATASMLDTDADSNPSNNTAPATVTVLNVPPKVTTIGMTPGTINENDSAVLSVAFTDPGRLDTHTARITWGDGSPDLTVAITPGARSFQVQHQFLDDNPTGTPSDLNAVHVVVTDNNGGTGSGDTSVLVQNLAPVLTAFSTNSPSASLLKEGDVVTVTGAFADLGTQDTHTATIDWDDGSTSSAAILESGGAGALTAHHTYTAGGIYTVRVTLADDDLGQVTASKSLFVTGVGVHRLPNGLTALEVVGTNGDDHVTINQQGNGQIKVHNDFLPEKDRTLGSAGIDVIDVVLLGGDDTVTISGGLGLPAILDGGAGNDHLNGGNGGNILIGGDGNDVLQGGNARDLLIGGTGADSLNGNGGDDILIGGRTLYDSGADDDKLTHDVDLLTLLKEWSSARSYDDRVANLTHGTGPILGGTGLLLQNGVTVFDELTPDTINGASGNNWIFLGVGDRRL